jgi:Uma2 family endonuclease
MSTVPQRKFLTPEEYLEIERKAEFRSEYFQGKMSAVPASNRAHNLIAINLVQALSNQLLERDGNVYLCNMRVKIEKIDKYVYLKVFAHRTPH